MNFFDTVGIDSAPVVMTISETFDCIDRREWDELVVTLEGSLYVTHDWLRIWWRHYGRNRTLRIFIFRQGKRLVGIAPIFIERVRLGPVAIRLAKRVGADFSLAMFGLPLNPHIAAAAYEKIIAALIEDERCAAVWLGFAPEDDPTIAGLQGACESLRSLVFVATNKEVVVHSQFNLPSTFDGYLGSLDKRQRQNYRRDVRLLEKNCDVRRRVVRDQGELPNAFERFITIHDAQWQEVGKLGHFGDWPDAVKFNADLVTDMSALDRLRIINLVADDVVVSSQYAFVFNGCCYWRLPARATGEWERFSLGRLGLIQLIESMIGEGVSRIEGGMGHYEYKVKLGGQELVCQSILTISNRSSDARSVRFFLRLSGLLHLIYYRVWFLRIAPYVPFARKPLWRTWIRSRL